MLDVTVSIVNHNSVEPLRVCLASVVENLAGLAGEIQVVDNACAEQAAAMLRAEFPAVRVISNTRVLGFGANHNQVLRRCLARSRYVLVLNPDTRLPPGLVPQLVAHMDEHPRAAVVSPSNVEPDGQVTPLPQRMIHLSRDLVMLAIYISDWPGALAWLKRANARRKTLGRRPGAAPAAQPPETAAQWQTGEVVWGAAMLLRSQAIEVVGLFDEAFFLYFDEYDWCRRAWRLGWENHWLPNLRIFHEGGHSTNRRDYYHYFQIRVESWLKFYLKHGGRLRHAILAGWVRLVIGLNLARLALAASGGANSPELKTHREFLVSLRARLNASAAPGHLRPTQSGP